MKHISTLFLKVSIIFIAAVVFLAFIRFPQIEGRAKDLDLISIYKDPVIIYIYIASIPFFVALFQAFKLLGLVDKDKVFSQTAVKAVMSIKYCAISIVAFFVGAEVYLFIVERGKSDDVAGGVMMGFLIIFASLIVAATANVFENILQKAITKNK